MKETYVGDTNNPRTTRCQGSSLPSLVAFATSLALGLFSVVASSAHVFVRSQSAIENLPAYLS